MKRVTFLLGVLLVFNIQLSCGSEFRRQLSPRLCLTIGTVALVLAANAAARVLRTQYPAVVVDQVASARENHVAVGADTIMHPVEQLLESKLSLQQEEKNRVKKLVAFNLLYTLTSERPGESFLCDSVDKYDGGAAGQEVLSAMRRLDQEFKYGANAEARIEVQVSAAEVLIDEYGADLDDDIFQNAIQAGGVAIFKFLLRKRPGAVVNEELCIPSYVPNINLLRYAQCQRDTVAKNMQYYQKLYNREPSWGKAWYAIELKKLQSLSQRQGEIISMIETTRKRIHAERKELIPIITEFIPNVLANITAEYAVPLMGF